MRVLFVTHPEADYLGYAVYDGLCDALGPENVVDYPEKASYHGEQDRYPSVYETGKEGVTGPFAWAHARPWHANDYPEIVAHRGLQRGEFDLVVMESPRSRAVEALRRLVAMGAQLPQRVVLLDGEDHTRWASSTISEFGVGLYLKRELLVGAPPVIGSCRIEPLSLAAYQSLAWPVDPATIDVLCAVGATHPAREAVADVVRRLPGIRVDMERCGWGEYIEKIRQSRIVVAPRGFGYDTMRRWEVPGAGGALLLAEQLPLAEHAPLVADVHCDYYQPDASDLAARIGRWLQGEMERMTVARAGHDFVAAHHTNAARARRLLELVSERWGSGS